MYASPTIVVTAQDSERLRQIITTHNTPAAERLDMELSRAQIVPQNEVSRDVVTMNSDVVYENVSQHTERTVRIVYPEDANSERGWISVLAPLGSALLGLRVGQEIEWPTPTRVCRYRVIAVPRQPESSGTLEL